ncbi:hypothetical protein C2E25_02690 [Geothermobacter hydrogeniphilus]|uniref:SurA N-terminal domain-containing protein n=1 Tax=Geothermobacter hydrogeniphilus TaxID=1969733 RepID=A0A2K2HD54_9BACT|nr:hypothetical protein [Geothermobacter hydrogeniphilus]PNU21225.1 hypothetical protein C2E25_02690 [Geothermobacter hydrogeniphilus]
MRYIYYIIGIILVAGLAVVATGHLLKPETKDDAALTVNGRTISIEEINNRQQYASYPYRSLNDFIDDLLTRELLIQEARRRGIDREESFRRAIQDQYEQSLIKLLLDRMANQLSPRVSDRDIAAYRACSTRRYRLRQELYDNPQAKNPLRPTRTIEDDFNALPLAWQLQLLPLKNGQKTPPFPVGNQYCVLRVERIKDSGTAVELSDDEIRRLLTDGQRQLALDAWMNGLRRTARIEKSPLLKQREGQK